MSLLFSPRRVGPLTLKNRIVVAPMCQYSAVDGVAQPWHAQHLGRLAVSGAGLVIVEATGVEAAGRITPDDTGLWNDAQAEAFADILKGIRTYSDTPIGVQLAHAGRKASTSAPWKGGGALSADDGAWETFAPSALPFRDDWHTPTAMTEADMDRVVDAFVQAARRADRAGFDLVELHAAHGYLLCEFLSPLSNQRTDAYGGSARNRARFPLRVAQALRDAWPRTKALGARFNGSDWIEGGVSLEEVMAFGQALHALGYDYLHLTSGGNVPRAAIPGDQPGYQVAFAEAMKAAAPEATVMAVGLIFDPQQAEAVVASGQADLVAIARAALDDPNWPRHAAVALGAPEDLPAQYAMAARGRWPDYGRSL
ncbi:NADH:flavin oxidoreductase/NADH oxidase [Brevundimonas sp. SORGH_AS_0993]|uniref:NADH:flavin oxidoreductase/NADH oxidase n=1 Tax=Brevundimonas sp. SORGH_AS_0993 TaxID=3041794 RepID=UPI0027835840|nr:NADH:flavin oxidoreductase/NADH oxidase [Brevundimonas sp. SORGH_AS_0993]MDQ1155348.1 2,4-dienoyl-CoA reductase-like NADH-dependent reductase (Old Yellow Enzyme family) [Brevundimonas sp. SORGH_AS_0993]